MTHVGNWQEVGGLEVRAGVEDTFRVRVQVRGCGFGQYPELRIEKLGMGVYEVIGMGSAIEKALRALGDDVEWAEIVTHRAVPVGYQQSRPYHRR
jgi:hypothetical protein